MQQQQYSHADLVPFFFAFFFIGFGIWMFVCKRNIKSVIPHTLGASLLLCFSVALIHVGLPQNISAILSGVLSVGSFLWIVIINVRVPTDKLRSGLASDAVRKSGTIAYPTVERNSPKKWFFFIGHGDTDTRYQFDGVEVNKVEVSPVYVIQQYFYSKFSVRPSILDLLAKGVMGSAILMTVFAVYPYIKWMFTASRYVHAPKEIDSSLTMFALVLAVVSIALRTLSRPVDKDGEFIKPHTLKNPISFTEVCDRES
ncbi:hypothetical protein L0244_38375, partial [bacterium]|nr:hypothetical protein [bacterium]